MTMRYRVLGGTGIEVSVHCLEDAARRRRPLAGRSAA
jgi:hypothetical protein